MAIKTNPQTNQAERGDAAAGAKDELFDLGRLFNVLLANKWLIAVCTAIGLLFAVYHLWTTPYTYRADTLIQIQSSGNSPLSNLSGTAAGAGGLAGLSSKSVAQSEIPIITSRAVVGETVRDLNMALSVGRHKTPIIGGLLPQSAASVDVARFDVPQLMRGDVFELHVKPNGSYTLDAPSGQKVLSGHAGKAASGILPGGGKASIFVRSITASGNATFDVKKRPWLSVTNGLSGSLTIQEIGTGSGILTMSYEGHNKDFITQVVKSVAQNYVDQNVEARSEDAQKSLKFLNSQLPHLKSKLNTAVGKLADYQEKNQPVDLSSEAQQLLGQASSLEDKRSQLRLQVAQLSQQYTSQYPELQAARRQLAELKQQSQQIKGEINKLPNEQKQMLSLQRDVKVNTDLYTSLLNRAQELRVVKAGTVGNVRIVDPAVEPVSPVAPNPKVVIFVGLVFGFLLGVAITVLRMLLKRGVHGPAAVEAHTGHSVYATVPESDWMANATKRSRRSGEAIPILARDRGDDMVMEALRGLRTSLYFAQMESGSNVIMMAGPAPGVGKSFLSVNLGYLLADIEKRVVVVDADMRRGHLHQFVAGRDRAPGLSEVLAGQKTLDECLANVYGSNLDIISSGQIPPNPVELLMRPSFRTMIDDLKSRYDLVIIDAPPVLAVTDAGVIAGLLPDVATFMVLQSGIHPMAEIDEAVERFARQGGSVCGFIMNRYRASKASATAGYSQYHYAYGSQK